MSYYTVCDDCDANPCECHWNESYEERVAREEGWMWEDRDSEVEFVADMKNDYLQGLPIDQLYF